MHKNLKLTNSLNSNIEVFKSIFCDDDTIIYRFFQNKYSTIQCCLIFIDGMVNSEIINENIIDSIMNKTKKFDYNTMNVSDYLINKVLILDEVYKLVDINEILDKLLLGYSVLLVEGSGDCILLNTKGWKTRAIEEPKSETIIKGPREGFTECLIMNLSMLRRKLNTKDFKVKFKKIGNVTKTKVSICYIQNIANDKIVEELEKRLDKIDIDAVLDSGYIEEFIRDAPFSPFKTVETSERPDTIAAKLLEGRIAVICDGSPEVIYAPFIFIEYFQVNEDYYLNYYLSSVNRLIRFICFFLSTSVPAIYVALTTYHQELIPTPLLLSIYSARQGVPFPTVIEAMLMLFVFELLREAGVRLPKYVGQAVSIVGALVIGQAASEANIVSAPMIIVTAITGISSFLIPRMMGALIVIRYIFLLLSSILGLYGYIFGIIGLVLHLMSMRTFGIPYMLYTNSVKGQNVKDVLIRAPWWYMKRRNKLIAKNPFKKRKKEGKNK